jgi:hypothetical protein
MVVMRIHISIKTYKINFPHAGLAPASLVSPDSRFRMNDDNAALGRKSSLVHVVEKNPQHCFQKTQHFLFIPLYSSIPVLIYWLDFCYNFKLTDFENA